MRSKKKRRQSALPPSGQIIGRLFDTARIPYPGYLAKEMQRYFRGERVHDDTKKQILYLLTETLLDDGIIPHIPVFDLAFLCPWGLKAQIVRGISEYADKWDSIRERTSYWSLSGSGDEKLLVSCLRLAAIDLALRVAAFRHLAKLPPPDQSVPLWVQRGGNNLYLKNLKDAAKVRNAHLMEASEVLNEKTVAGWLYKGRRPSREHLRGLAKMFATHISGANETDLRWEMNRQYAFSALCDRLADRIGQDRVIVLTAALIRFAARLQGFFGDDPKPAEENYSHYLTKVILGIRSSTARPYVERLFESETDPGWKRDLVCVGGEWVPRLIQDNLRFTGESILRRVHNWPFFPGDAGRISPHFDYISATHIDRMVDGETALRSGAGNEAYGWDEKTEGDLRDAVARDHGNARAHLSLGVYLGMNSYLPQQVEQVEEGFRECAEAQRLRPKWDLPRIEAAHIQLRAGNHNEALACLRRATEELPRASARLAYTTAFSEMLIGDLAGALSMFEWAIRLKPDYALALDNAGYCAFRIGDNVKGRRYAKAARLCGVSTTYDLYDVGKTKRKPTPVPFPTLCESIPCPVVGCEGRAEAERIRENWHNTSP